MGKRKKHPSHSRPTASFRHRLSHHLKRLSSRPAPPFRFVTAPAPTIPGIVVDRLSPAAAKARPLHPFHPRKFQAGPVIYGELAKRPKNSVASLLSGSGIIRQLRS